ncbi:ethanolamine utilization protein EutQ [Roseovarius aestuarii]|uniref:Ethanolamine utilization protein EutQ n=1 Tax=Roseovarius aestuarii TaxID=475083 RepID=A0A1X7BPC4_9RHOB|nr:ethanolamine utilization protein EutQ [Roseovarius aestuarii]SMC11374.1 Ethanolamine utilization protein EutQ [Roseovarius aestuarii]
MSRKAHAHVVSLSAAEFTPRFAYGHMAEVSVVTGTGGEGTRLGSGFVRMSDAEIPWTIQYDEVILVLEGQLTVRTHNGDLVAGPMECIWLPDGTELTYIAEEALVFYAIEPANWAEE